MAAHMSFAEKIYTRFYDFVRFLSSARTSAAQEPINTREQLLYSLRGSHLTVPDLQALLKEWPQYVNQELDRLRVDADEKLRELFPESDRLRKMRAADAGLFAASWWPYASYEALKTAMYLSIWLFAWDDESDSAEYSSMVFDYEMAKAFRIETARFAHMCLLGDKDTTKSYTPESAIIASFRPIGEAISQSCTPSQTKAFYRETTYFLELTDLEQRVQMSNKLPTVEEYRQRRTGSSAVGMCLAITEYCFGMEIPPEVMQSKDMRKCWDEINTIISSMNDLLSIRKEIEQDQVDTLLPLLYVQHHGNLDAAMAEAISIIKSSIKGFDILSQRLLEQHISDAELYNKLRKFFHGCRCACTANLNWSLGSGRFKLGLNSTDGGITIDI